jgi:hypothetical protein
MRCNLYPWYQALEDLGLENLQESQSLGQLVDRTLDTRDPAKLRALDNLLNLIDAEAYREKVQSNAHSPLSPQGSRR